MKFRLGETDARNVLREMRGHLIEDRDVPERNERERERWEAFTEAAEKIASSVGQRDLTELASGVRRMKNLLRRPSVRKDLAKLEANEKAPDKIPQKGKDARDDDKPKGGCKCAECGSVIDGYQDCVDGALCVKCAMKRRDAPAGEKDDKDTEKKAKKAIAFPPEMTGAGGEAGQELPPEEDPEEEPEKDPKKEPPKKEKPQSLRRRKADKKKRDDEDEDEQGVKRKGKKQRRQESKRLRRRDYSRVLEDFDL